jgi:hypothetical protein
VTAASAQSTVTLSGTYGGAVQSFTKNAVKEKGVAVTDSSVKFTATEDLGGGLKATAAMQFSMGNERGASSTNGLTKEDSSISVSGGFGTVTLANTRTSDTGFNAMVFAAWLPRASWYDTVSQRTATDVISYTSPAIMPGLTLGVSQAAIGVGPTGAQCGADGITTNGTAGSAPCASVTGYKTTTLSANYANGPMTVMLAQKNTNFSAALVTGGAEKGNTELAAIYDFGAAKVGVAYDGKTTTTGKALTGFSVNVPVGAMAIGFNTATRGDNKFTQYGLNYSLSKRTTLSAQAGKHSGVTSNLATTSTVGNQYRVGVMHTF